MLPVWAELDRLENAPVSKSTVVYLLWEKKPTNTLI